MDQVQMSKRELERYTVMRQIEEQLISRRQAALALNLSERQVRSRGLGFKKTRSHDLTARIINKCDQHAFVRSPLKPVMRTSVNLN